MHFELLFYLLIDVLLERGVEADGVALLVRIDVAKMDSELPWNLLSETLLIHFEVVHLLLRLEELLDVGMLLRRELVELAWGGEQILL